MALSDMLNDSVNKERGGRHGGKGHEFHRYWALCHLLELDSEKDDYLMLLEFIEDVAVLDSETFPEEIDLYQVKKKEGKTPKWTKATLLNTKKGKSILAKLHESKSIAQSETSSIAFVSNVPVELNLTNGEDPLGLSEFVASQIDAPVLENLKSEVAAELGCSADDIDFSTLRFVRSPLAMNDLEIHATGRVASFLAKKFPDYALRADVLCKALYSEITVKATSTEDSPSFIDLKRVRGISKEQFSSMLELTLSRKPDNEVVDAFLESLKHEMVSFGKRSTIKKAARQFLVDKAGGQQGLLSVWQRHVEESLSTLPDHLVTSWEVANWIAAIFKVDVA